MSVFGSTDVPTSIGADPIATANTMAAWVIQYSLDGIDVDYEVDFFNISSEHTLIFGQDFNAFDAGDGKAEVS